MLLLKNFRFWLTLMATLSYLLVLSDISRGAEQTAAKPIRQSVYLWQKNWDNNVREALVNLPGEMNSLAVLASEISWKGENAYTSYVDINWKSLRDCNRPITLVIRSGSYLGKYDRNSALVFLLASDALLFQAEEHGVSKVSIQIDFDCPESKLAGYGKWLKILRAHLKSTGLSITTLPCWLKNGSFRDLLDYCDYYVLQVHSLQPPQYSDNLKICNMDQSLRWIYEANQTGKPFLVALPTYGYLVAFSQERKFLGLSAEGPQRQWPQGSIIKIARSDPVEIASIARTILSKRSKYCKGIIWFRLPIKTDRLNWPLATLQAAMQGKTPQSLFQIELKFPQPQLAEITLSNRGETELTCLPDALVQYNGIMPVALDGYNLFNARITDSGKILFTRKSLSLPQRLTPGEKLKVGWIRFNEKVTDGEIHVETR